MIVTCTCGQANRVPDAAEGKTVRCAQCKRSLGAEILVHRLTGGVVRNLDGVMGWLFGKR